MRTKKPAEEPQTPVGQLHEAGLQGVLGYQLAQASVVSTRVFMEEVGGPFELRPVEFTLLALIQENPGVSARQLARALAVTPPNLTTWVDRLEQRGLVARERSSADRRAQHIRTTPAGAELARTTIARIVAAERQALGGLSPAEQAMLLELLHKAARGRRQAGD